MKWPLLCLALWGGMAVAQPIDWAGDVTLFGTTQDEHHPCLAASSESVLHAFCMISPDTLAMKRSSDNGASWSVASKYTDILGHTGISVSGDNEFVYLIAYGANESSGHVFRWYSSGSDWNSAIETGIAPERQDNVICLTASTDVAARPVDPYLNVVWTELSSEGIFTTAFAQSRDRGLTFLPANVIHSASAPAGMQESVALTVSWEGDLESIHVATPVDRPGSMPEEIRVYTSTNQGAEWSAGFVVDSSGYPQRSPCLAAFDGTVFLVYARRTDVAAQRAIFLTYSPDNGQSFAPPFLIADSVADEYNPQIVVDATGIEFHVFYIVSAVLEDTATLYVRSGSVASPWQIGPAISISDPLTALASGGYSVVVNAQGVMVAWTAPFLLGDSDVRYDASWRTSAVAPSVNSNQPSFSVGAYPNPFNGTTEILVNVVRDQRVNLCIYNMLGQKVGSPFVGLLSSGQHRISLDLSADPTGIYWIGDAGGNQLPLKLTLVR